MNLLKKNSDNTFKEEVYTKYEKKNQIIKKIKKVFKLHGYREISTPTLEKYNVFSNIEGAVNKKEMLKFIDETGEILVFRPDSTTPIAKMVANNYESLKGNLKLCYVNNIFRLSKTNKINKKEFTQAGIEYFGNSIPECDGEVIAMAIKSLLNNFNDFQIDIGQADFYKGILDQAQFNKSQKNKLKKLVENKNIVEIRRMLGTLDIDKKIKKVILELPNLYGEVEDVINRAEDLIMNEKMSNALNNLRKVYSVLNDYGYNKYISLDLGLVTDLDYYTGVIFKGYIANHATIVLSGGRYDSLTSEFGKAIPATGFGINIDEILEANQKIYNYKQGWLTDFLIIYKEEDRKKAFEFSDLIRDKGYIVETSLCSNLKKQITNATENNTKEVIVYGDKKIKIVQIDRNNVMNIDKNTFIKNIDKRKDKLSLVSTH